MVTRGPGTARGQFIILLNISGFLYKNHESEMVDQNSPFEKFRQGGQKEDRMREIKIEEGHRRASQNQ